MFGVFDQLKKLEEVYLSGNICVNEYYGEYFSDLTIIQLKHENKSKCNNPNDPYEIITNLQQENKELNLQLLKSNEDLKQSMDALKIDQRSLKNGQDVLKNDQGALKSYQDALKMDQGALQKDQDVLKEDQVVLSTCFRVGN